MSPVLQDHGFRHLKLVQIEKHQKTRQNRTNSSHSIEGRRDRWEELEE